MATFGTGFSQHLGVGLRARKFDWIDAEPAPAGLSDTLCRRFGYRTQSCRLGTFHTISMFYQWLTWVDGSAQPSARMWEHNGRYFDPYRPLIEPDGFASEKEGLAARAITLQALSDAIEAADVLALTVSSNETWISTPHGEEYPMYPGVVPGTSSGDAYAFRYLHFEGCKQSLIRVTDKLRKINPDIRVLLLLSPEPLIATVRNRHALAGTAYTKAILRAVTGQIAESRDFVAYAPLYELLTHPAAHGSWFESDLRRVNSGGMEFAMNCFFSVLHQAFGGQNDLRQPVSHRISFQDEDDTRRVMEAWL